MKLDDLKIWERVRDSWEHYLHIGYMVVVVGSAYATGVMAVETKARIVLCALLLYFAVLLLAFAYFVHAFARKARYAEALHSLQRAQKGMRDLQTFLVNAEHVDEAEVATRLVDPLTELRAAFTLATGAPCRTCVKLIGGDAESNAYVQTLSRDSSSRNDCADRDRSEGALHLISQNTDFNLIMHGGEPFVLINDLMSERTYINTSKQTYDKGRLPYRSALTVPAKSPAVYEGRKQVKDEEVLGFLCIDSPARNTFTQRFDAEMALLVANGLGNVLETYAKRIEAAASEERSHG